MGTPLSGDSKTRRWALLWCDLRRSCSVDCKPRAKALGVQGRISMGLADGPAPLWCRGTSVVLAGDRQQATLCRTYPSNAAMSTICCAISVSFMPLFIAAWRKRV